MFERVSRRFGWWGKLSEAIEGYRAFVEAGLVLPAHGLVPGAVHEV